MLHVSRCFSWSTFAFASALVVALGFFQGCFTDGGEKGQSSASGSDTPPIVIPGNGSANHENPETPSQNGDSGKSTSRRILTLDMNGDTTKSWQSLFIRDSSEIPLNEFKVFYFQDTTGTNTGDSERVAFPALSYGNTGPHGIPAQRFNAYWIGKFDFAEITTWRIDLSQSWSIARILVDKHEIFSGQESHSLQYTFSEGRHILEIEYKNDWHTIGFSVLFSPVVANPPAVIIDTAATGAEYWYAGVYESGNSDLSLKVELKKSTKPVVLFLSSYDVVRWNIVPADSNQILAVFVDSYEPQSTVTGLRASVPVTIRKGIPWAYKLLPECHPQIGYCEENGFKKMVDYLAHEFKVSPTGFTGAYNPATLSLPELILNSAKLKEIEEQTRALVESSKLHLLVDVFPGDTAATWQSHFVTSDLGIPVGKFQAFYFSDKKPESVIHSEIVAAPVMKYSWSEFHSLDANDFAGYWIGKFNFAAPTILDFGIEQGHAETAIYIDKHSILASPTAMTVTVSLTAGTHLIEIQHINNWHTIEYSVTMKPR